MVTSPNVANADHRVNCCLHGLGANDRACHSPACGSLPLLAPSLAQATDHTAAPVWSSAWSFWACHRRCTASPLPAPGPLQQQQQWIHLSSLANAKSVHNGITVKPNTTALCTWRHCALTELKWIQIALRQERRCGVERCCILHTLRLWLLTCASQSVFCSPTNFGLPLRRTIMHKKLKSSGAGSSALYSTKFELGAPRLCLTYADMHSVPCIHL